MVDFSALIQGWIEDQQCHVNLNIGYRVVDPMVFRLTFMSHEPDGLDQPVTWIAGRELFRDAIAGKKAGDGDFQLTPFAGGRIQLTLYNGLESVEILFNRSSIASVVRKSYSLMTDAAASEFSAENMAQQIGKYLQMR